MDKQEFDEDPLDKAFVAEDLEDLDLDESTSKQEPSINLKGSLLSSIKIKPEETHQVSIAEQPLFENMKEWNNNEDINKLQQMIRGDHKRVKQKPQAPVVTKNIQPSSSKMTKPNKPGHY